MSERAWACRSPVTSGSLEYHNYNSNRLSGELLTPQSELISVLFTWALKQSLKMNTNMRWNVQSRPATNDYFIYLEDTSTSNISFRICCYSCEEQIFRILHNLWFCNNKSAMTRLWLSRAGWWPGTFVTMYIKFTNSQSVLRNPLIRGW